MVYININKDFLEKTKEKAHKLAMKEVGDEDGQNILLYTIDDTETRIDEITEDGVIDVVSDSKFGWVSFKVKLDEEDYIKMAGLIIKKMNKFKSVIESVK